MATQSNDTAFEQNAQSFYDYGQAVRGHVRYTVLHRNLKPLLTTPGLNVADVGGGSAIDAVWAAQLGHNVTVIEPAEAQIELASQRIEVLDDTNRQRIELVKGTVRDVLESRQGLFDVVFCHGVAMYLIEPGSFIKDIVKLAKPGGHISLLEKGFHGTEARLIAERKFDEFQQLQTTQRTFNRQKRDVYAFLPEELTDLLSKAGARVLEWSGIRVVSEPLADKVKDMDPKVVSAIVNTEYAQGHNPNIRGQGQMLHFLAQKTIS